jgi:murein DD-endopeptidase MepM/ murein hydrolase activator NlpD
MKSVVLCGIGGNRIVLLVLCLASLTGCSNPFNRTSSTTQNNRGNTNSNPFEAYLQADSTPADGFDFPFGRGDGTGVYRDKTTGQTYDGWYVATHFGENYSLGIHPGEDWNGIGGGNTELGQDVFSVANGRVVFAENCGRLWGNVVVIDHVFYENHERKKIRSLYAHLQKINVGAGDAVRRRQPIGTVGQDPEKLFNAHLHLELRWDDSLPPTYWPSSNGKDLGWIKERYVEPTSFIKEHRKTFVPQAERDLVLIDQASYKMRVYRNNALRKEYDVSFGQGSGPKQIEGDNKTPAGMYFVIQKHKGKFDGPYGRYYGGHWIKINYPNKFDAARGRRQRLINGSQETSITGSWGTRAATAQNTPLGGGIGFHGWIEEWKNDGSRHLSWGCVVLHLADIGEFYDGISEGTMVVIF